MHETLNDALNAAKKDRQTYSKVIIGESGVGKSQFYRIIRGEETPSTETKSRIMASLNISNDEFDVLFKQSKADQKQGASSLPPEPANQRRFSIKVLMVIALCLTPLLFYSIFLQNRQTSTTTQVIVASPEDQTLFIEDVTIPDGTPIPVNTQYVKTWRVKNTGTVAWKNRYLKRITPYSDILCSSPAMVPIPETLPGQIVDISVTFTTPHLPGTCRTDWKSSDEHGNLYHPAMHGLFSIVVVIAE